MGCSPGAVLTDTLLGHLPNTPKFVPVVFSSHDAVHIPTIFRASVFYDISSEQGYEQLYRRITNQPKVLPWKRRKSSLERSLPREVMLAGIRVFLCHSSKDKPAVRELYKSLSLYGAQPWLDEEDLLAGQFWKIEIPKAIRAAHAVIVCLSPNAITRTGYFHKEITFALDVLDEHPEGAMFIIPVKLEECDIPERLGHIHCVNLFEFKGFEKLVKSLRSRTEQLGLNNTHSN